MRIVESLGAAHADLDSGPPMCTKECPWFGALGLEPLVLKPEIQPERGYMFGFLPHVLWGEFAAGPARSLGDCLQFC